MSEKDIQILKTFGRAVPMLTDAEKDKLLAFSEGVAFMAERKHGAAESPPEGRDGAA